MRKLTSTLEELMEAMNAGETLDSQDFWGEPEKQIEEILKAAPEGTKISCETCCLTKTGSDSWLAEEEFGDGGETCDTDFAVERINDGNW